MNKLFTMMLFQVIGGKSTEKRVHRNKNERNRSPDEAWGSKTSEKNTCSAEASANFSKALAEGVFFGT